MFDWVNRIMLSISTSETDVFLLSCPAEHLPCLWAGSLHGSVKERQGAAAEWTHHDRHGNPTVQQSQRQRRRGDPPQWSKYYNRSSEFILFFYCCIFSHSLSSLFTLSTVPAVLHDVLPVTSKSIESELSVLQSLVWKYTALLEKLTQPEHQSTQCDVPLVLLKQALYNVRQHEVFLKLLQVSSQWAA